MAAVAATTIGTLPVFLLGALAVLVRADLGFSESQLGGAASAFFASSAVASVPAGRAAQRWGARATTVTGTALAGIALAGVALAVGSWPPLVALLVVGGAGNALAQIGSNLGLAQHVPPERQGLAYGVKQSAIPTATLLGGLAVPVVGLTIGWRWAFGVAAIAPVAYALLAPRDVPPGAVALHGVAAAGAPSAGHRAGGGPPRRAGGRPARPRTDTPTRALVVLACGVGTAAAGANAFGAFLVESAVDVGLAPGTAGLVFAAGSAVGIAGRLLAGWRADHRDGRHLPVVAGQLAVGSVGLALLAVASAAWGPGAATTALVILGTLLGFGLGWSWPGLFTFAVVRLNRGAPAAATSITQAGVFAGGALGPLAFGTTVELASYTAAWAGAAAALVVAAGLVLAGRRQVLAGLPRAGDGLAPEHGR